MKKICILIFTLMSSILGFSQLLEVKGVETKSAVYNGKIYSYDETEWFGYSFYNMNGFPISIEAELYKIYKRESSRNYDSNIYVEDAILIDTKTFNLLSKETYIWKQEHEPDFQKADKEYPHGDDSGGDAIKYHVKYKADKME